MKQIFSTFSLLTVSTCLQVPPATPAHFHPSNYSIRSFLAGTHGDTHRAMRSGPWNSLLIAIKGHVTWGLRAMTSSAELIKRNVFFMMRELDCALEAAQHVHMLSVMVIWSNNQFRPWQKNNKITFGTAKTRHTCLRMTDCSPGYLCTATLGCLIVYFTFY